MIQISNRVKQFATYKTGTPNYLDLAGSAVTGMSTVASRASSDSWSDGDQVGVLIVKSDSNWAVWRASWDATGSTLEQTEVEDSAGSLANDDAVTISITPTRSTLEFWRSENQREVLTAARTYYVATTGADNNNGLTAGSPFLTIQKAIDVVCSLDLSIYQATIQLANGTYTEGVSLKYYVGELAPIIQGNASDHNAVHLSATNRNTISATGFGRWSIKNVKLSNTTSGACLVVDLPGLYIVLDGVNFGQSSSHQILITDLGVVEIKSSYTISGPAATHAIVARSGNLKLLIPITVTLIGTPFFSTAFLQATQLGSARYSRAIFSGGATGNRYLGDSNSVINTAGGGATYLPGSIAGSVSTGAQYL